MRKQVQNKWKNSKLCKIAEEDNNVNIITGGHRLTDNGLDKGYFFEPTLIEVNDNSNQLAQEEIFGPVLVIEKFENDEDAVKLLMILNMV